MQVCKKLLAMLLGGSLIISMLAGCGQERVSEETNSKAQAEETVSETEQPKSEDTAAAVRQVTDAAGNVVEIPADISRIAVTPIPWSSVI